MKLLYGCFIAFLIECNYVASNSYFNNLPPEVKTPPRIIEQSDETVYAIFGVPLKLSCAAEAQPPVQNSGGYIWFKNGQPLEVSYVSRDDVPSGSIVMSPPNGSIQFWKSQTLSESDLKDFEGVYSCHASNEFGTAISNNMTVKLAAAVSQPPENKVVTADEGRPFTLPCHYEVEGGGEVTWTFLKNDIGISNRIGQLPDGGLVFSYISAEIDDNLGLFCSFKSKITRRAIDGIHYTIKVNRGGPATVEPKILFPNETKIVVLRGETIALTCVGTGKPAPELKWDKLSGGWPTNRTTVEDSGRFVRIQNASFDDTNNYRCSVKNSPVFTVVYVRVEAKPYFTNKDRRPINVVRSPGENITIRCQPEGIPRPTIEWRMNGEPLKEHPRLFKHDHSLKLIGLQKSDTAVYQCVSRNVHGSVIAQGYLDVLTSKPLPRPENHPVYKQVEGKHVTIKCRIFGSPPPLITWMKNKSNLSASNRLNFSKSHHLQIKKLHSSDAGVYSCEAVNNYGRYTLNYTLNVLKSTQLSIAKVKEIVRGETVVFTAQVVADPDNPPVGEIEWLKSGQILAQGDSYEIPNIGFRNAGTYLARVRTALDSDEKYFNLIVVDRPLPPEDFSFDIMDDPLVVRFNWIPGNDFFSSITVFKIEFEENVFNPGVWQTLVDEIEGNKKSKNVTLNAGVNYKFRAFARNNVGWSSNSSTETRRYKTPDGLPSIPSFVRAEGNKPGYVKVWWEKVPGILQHAPGFGYRLKYKPQNPDVKAWSEVNLRANESEFEFKGAEAFLPYQIELTTFNDKDVSNKAPLLTTAYTGEDVPKVSPTDIKVFVHANNPRKVTLQWTKIDESKVRGRVLGYNISVVETATGDTKYLNSSNVDRIESYDMRQGTKYEFRVAAFTSAGVGPFSKPVIRKTPRGAPEPGNINVTADDKKAMVFWTPSGGLPADIVVLQHRVANSKDTWQETEWKPASHGKMMFEVKINSTVDYEFRVVARNKYGNVTSQTILLTDNSDTATSGFSLQLWLIVIIILIVLILIIVIIVCLLRSRRGRKYSVADKEKHFVEVQPLEDVDAGDYNNENDDVKKPLTDGKSSNGNPKKMPLRTRGDSIGGDSIEDPKEFNEDGSFIGQYGVINSPSSNETPSTPPNESQSPVDNRKEGVV